MVKGNMMKDIMTIPTNKNRAIAKKVRGKGQLAMEESKMNLVEWTRHHDPLYSIKGKERHKRMCSL
ncbi:MAG: hypothetical protein ACOC1K_05985 [Nanoarchaeota archaeon]